MKKGHRYSEAEKTNHIKAYQESGLTKLEYSEANKISISTVNRWLNSEDKKVSNVNTNKSANQWVELNQDKKDKQSQKSECQTITIEIGKIKLEISEEIDIATLEEILKVVLKVC